MEQKRKLTYIILLLICFSPAKGASTSDTDTDNDAGENTIEVESAIIRCTEQNDDEQVINWKPQPLTSFNEKIEPGPHEPDSELKLDLENDIDLKLEKMSGCKKKMLVTVKVTNKGMETDDGSIIKVDHVKDEETGQPSRVGQPIAIKLQQGPMFKAYSLRYITTVNADPHEEVINYLNTKDFKGCNDGDKNPTCGFQKNEQTGEIILSSRGFCCECDKAEQDKDSKQIRGGQKCTANNTGNLYASAHCLRYSDYWYGVYELGETEVFHPIYVEVYQSVELENGTVHWEEIGGNNSIAMIDSLETKEYRKGNNLTIIYRKFDLKPSAKGTWDPTNNYLLIPKPFLVMDSDGGANIPPYSSYPKEFTGAIGDTYLVVPKKSINPSGTQCDIVGVDHDGFRSQRNPCIQNKGSCLKNQPFQLWKGDDSESASTASNSHYRLKSYGTIHKVSPFKMIHGNLYLIMEHDDEVSAYIDIEVSADHLDVAKPGYNVAISSVTGESGTTAGKLFVEVANNEAVASYYSVHLLQCTEGIPLQKSERVLIDALNTEDFQLNIKHYPHKLSSVAKCSVGVINVHNEVVAIRKVLLSPTDTCICSGLCACACTKISLECIELSLGEIKAAGIGDAEFGRDENQNQTVNLGNYMEYLIPLLILILLILGICKGMIGRLCCKSIGLFGLGVFHQRPRKLKQYFEKEYSRSKVVYDDDGNPVDPFTKKPTVKRFSSTEELGLNSVFFLCCPIIFLWTLISYYAKCIKAKETKDTGQRSTNFSKPALDNHVDYDYEADHPDSNTSSKRASKTSTLRTVSSMPNQPHVSRNTSGSAPQVRSLPTVMPDKNGSNQGKESPASSRTFNGTSRTYGSWHRKPENAPDNDAKGNVSKSGSPATNNSASSGIKTPNSILKSKHSSNESNENEQEDE